MEIAIRQAVVNRGVSVVVIPGDVALQSADVATAESRGSSCPPCDRDAVANDVDLLATLLNGNGHATMLCGSGCQGAHDQVIGLADRLKAPIVHAFRGKEHIEWEPTHLTLE